MPRTKSQTPKLIPLVVRLSPATYAALLAECERRKWPIKSAVAAALIREALAARTPQE